MRLQHLTFTRFIASFSVICFHFIYHQPNLFYPFNLSFFKMVFNHGDLAVPYFFILSGFILAVVYSQPSKKNIKIFDFYILRLSRIIPAYALSLILLAPIFIIYEFPPLSTLIINILILQGWFNNHTINFASWSLTVEIFFYILFPIIIRLIHEIKNKYLIISSILFLIIYYYFIKNLLDKVIFFPPPIRYIFHFYLGMVYGVILYPSIIKYKNKKIFNNYISIFILFILSICLYINIYFYNGGINNDIYISIIFTGMIIAFALDKSILSEIFNWWPLILLGEISYAMYILQFPVYYCFNEICDSLYLNFQILIFQKGSAVNFWTFIIFLITTSWLCFHFIENPIRNYIHKKLNITR